MPLQLDVTSESLITLAEAAKRLPGRPSIPTLWRWCTRGVRGVRLQHVRIGRRMYTSVDALNDFAAACAERNAGDVDRTSTEEFLLREGFGRRGVRTER